MKIFISGGSGYTGTILVKKLLENNHKVISFDTQWFGNHLKKHKNLKRSLKKVDAENKLNDIQATFYHIKNDSYQLRSTLPYAANIGFDGTGENSGVRDGHYVDNMPQDDHIFFISDKEISYDVDFDRKYYQHFYPKLSWAKMFKKLLT